MGLQRNVKLQASTIQAEISPNTCEPQKIAMESRRNPSGDQVNDDPIATQEGRHQA